MTISYERLHAACVRLHAAAENNHRVHGFAAPLLVFLPETGPEDLVLVPDGIPPQHVLDAFARRADAVAILTTGEAWVSVPGLSAQQMAALPPEDLPRPSSDPDRAEAIVTHGVGIGPDGTTMVLTRASRIRRTPFGTMVSDPVDGVPGTRRDGATEALAAALRPPAQPGGGPRPARTRKDTPMPTPHAEPGAADLSACPSCSVSVGALHTDACCIFPIESSC